MLRLGARANINTFEVSINGQSISVIVYDDHRTILNVLYYARMKGILKQTPNLVFFDRHDDACDVDVATLQKMNEIPLDESSFPKFMNFVEFDLRAVDDNWLWAGMHYGLIKNVIRVGGEDIANIPVLNKAFKDRDQRMYSVDYAYLAAVSVGQQAAVDMKENDDRCIRQMLGRVKDDNGDPIMDSPLVLDFDLDCFSEYDYQKDDFAAWSSNKFEELICNTACMHSLMQELMLLSGFVTICREPGCCGGYKESNQILSYLDQSLFNGKLKA